MSIKYFNALSYADTETLVKRVCEIIGHGGAGSRVDLMMEVIYWKSLNGAVRPLKHNRFGVAQLSAGAIKLVQNSQKEKTQRCMQLLSREFYVDLIDVKPIELELSPMLSICFLGLISVNITENIPLRRHYDGEPEGRAEFAVKYGSTEYCSSEVGRYLDTCKVLDDEAIKAKLLK